MRLLVTGASGFIGSALLRAHAHEPTNELRAAVRRPIDLAAGISEVLVDDIGPGTNWDAVLDGVDAVVHAAARVHVMRDATADPLAEYRRVNVAGTLRLAEAAATRGTRRLVFMSSVKVNGERTAPGVPFTPHDRPAPCDPYSISKLEAEQGLRAIARESSLQVVIIRPVLVYGRGVKGNFLAMMRALRRGVPFPLRNIDNRRSLLALDNLVDLIRVSLRSPNAANETFMAADGDDLSTPDLLSRMANALGVPARLFPVPQRLLQISAHMLGRSTAIDRLCDSLQVDIAKTRELLSWTPPVDVDTGLHRAAQAFLQSPTP